MQRIFTILQIKSKENQIKVAGALSRKYKNAHKTSSDLIHELMTFKNLKISEEGMIKLEKEYLVRRGVNYLFQEQNVYYK